MYKLHIMKYLKWLLATVLVFFLAAVASTFFMSENFRVSHTQLIKASPEAVYDQIVVTKNWKNWSYWNTLDDKMVTTYNDIPSGVGASYTWQSEKLGNGSLIIERTIVNEYVQSRLKFEGQGDGFSEYIIRKTAEGTELTSAMNSKTDGIFAKLMSRFIGKPYMSKAFKAGAERMDAYLQAHPYVASSQTTSINSTKIVADSSKNTTK